MLAPGIARTALSRELLALSSVLGIARTGGLLSVMNAELISREAHILLQEVAAYEEPRLFLDDAPTLSGIAKSALKKEVPHTPHMMPAKHIAVHATVQKTKLASKGQVKDNSDTQNPHIKDRREAVMSVIRNKGSVSEKTIQRELMALIESGTVLKQGERRWSTYSLA